MKIIRRRVSSFTAALFVSGALAWGSLESGGRRAMVGSYQAHPSLGSPFYTACVISDVTDVVTAKLDHCGKRNGESGGNFNGVNCSAYSLGGSASGSRYYSTAAMR